MEGKDTKMDVKDSNFAPRKGNFFSHYLLDFWKMNSSAQVPRLKIRISQPFVMYVFKITQMRTLLRSLWLRKTTASFNKHMEKLIPAHAPFISRKTATLVFLFHNHPT